MLPSRKSLPSDKREMLPTRSSKLPNGNGIWPSISCTLPKPERKLLTELQPSLWPKDLSQTTTLTTESTQLAKTKPSLAAPQVFHSVDAMSKPTQLFQVHQRLFPFFPTAIHCHQGNRSFTDHAHQLENAQLGTLSSTMVTL